MSDIQYNYKVFDNESTNSISLEFRNVDGFVMAQGTFDGATLQLQYNPFEDDDDTWYDSPGDLLSETNPVYPFNYNSNIKFRFVMSNVGASTNITCLISECYIPDPGRV